jgi:hypothetical protein
MATIDNFFSVFDPSSGPGIYLDVDYLMDQFSGSPKVGIANNASPSGPQFSGYVDVSALFTRLFNCFQKLSFKAIPPYCSDTTTKTVIVQATLKTDVMQNKWFQPSDGNFYSKPLSDIVPDGAKKSTIAACVVFTFDASNKIDRLGIYMDRWQMAVDLWDGKPAHPFPHP